MIPVLRSAFALTVKEVYHHAIPLVFIAFWSLMMVPIFFTLGLGMADSMASMGVRLVFYYGPLAVLLIVRRLVVQEYTDGTTRFLDALPAPKWLQFSAKLAVGWVTSVGIVLGCALPLLGLATLREYVTVFWFSQLVLAIVLYISGWLVLTFAIAQLGRFRHWAWLTLVVVVAALDTQVEGTDSYMWTWHASLALPVDETRLAFPWVAFTTTSLWIVCLGVLAAFLAIFRGGALPGMAFQSGSTRGRVSGAALVLGLFMGSAILPNAGTDTLDGWYHLPQAEVGVYIAGDVGSWSTAAKESLDALNELAPLIPPTQLVLAVDYGRPDASESIAFVLRPGPRVRVDNWDRDAVHIRVRDEPTVADKARIIDMILKQRSAGVARFAADRGFAYDGLGLYLVEAPTQRNIAEQRAALALQQGLTASDLEDWERVRAKIGPDLAAGVGAIGLAVVDRPGLGPWVAEHLLPVLSDAARASRQLRRIENIAGLTLETHRQRWWTALEDARDRRKAETATFPNVAAVVTKASDPQSNLDIAWEVTDGWTTGMEILVQPVDPLRGRPAPWSHAYRPLVSPIEVPSGRTVSWFSANTRVFATVRKWDERIGGFVTSGLVEVAP